MKKIGRETRSAIRRWKNHIKLLKKDINCVKKIKKLFGLELRKLYNIMNKIDYTVADCIWHHIENNGELNTLISEWKLELKEIMREKQIKRMKKDISYVEKISKLFGSKLKKLYIILNRIDCTVADCIWYDIKTKGELNSLISEWKLDLKKVIEELEEIK